MDRRFSRFLGPVISITLFSVAFLVLNHELGKYRFEEIMAGLRAIPGDNILLAALLTVSNYIALTGFDFLGLRYVGRRLGYPRVALASFISYAFSHNMGLSILSGGSVRYYLYTGWGLSPIEVANVIAFCAVTYIVGLITISGAVITIVPQLIPPSLYQGLTWLRAVGAAFLIVSALYILLSAVNVRPLKLRGWEFRLPGAPLAVAQIVMASIEFALVGGIIYVLLPSSVEVTYLRFLGVFLAANFAGMLSHIPGGLGVFETVLLLLLSPDAPSSSILSALIVYRGMYFIFPFAVSLALFGGFEAVQRRGALRRAAETINFSELLPHFLAFTVFVAGASFVIAGIPSFLEGVYPPPGSEYIFGALGAGLLILSRGALRRVEGSYRLSIALLLAGLILIFISETGLIYGIPSAIALLLLFPAKGVFYRKASMLHEPVTPGWAATLLLAPASIFLVGLSLAGIELKEAFSSVDDAYLTGHVRVFIGALATVLVFFTLKRVFVKPHRIEAEPSPADLELASKIAGSSGRAAAKLALSGDKALFFSPNNDAFIMYSMAGRSRVSLEGPIGASRQSVELAWHFTEKAAGTVPVFFNVAEEGLRLYSDLGLTPIKIGDEASVRLREPVPQEEKRYEELKNAGFSIEIVEADEALAARLKEINDEWASVRRAKGFSVGVFSGYYIRSSKTAVIRHKGRLAGFSNILYSGRSGEIYPDIVRFRKDSGEGIEEFFLLGLVIEGRRLGFKKLSLGLVPSKDVEEIVTSKDEYVEAFYTHSGLMSAARLQEAGIRLSRAPRYLAYPGGFDLPEILDDIVSLILRKR